MLNSSTYWVEGINGLLYDAIIVYMEKHDFKRKDLAEHLGISRGRVSQILNDGDINFSMEKIIEIALKVDKFPVFSFEDKNDFLQNDVIKNAYKNLMLEYNNESLASIESKKLSKTKVIQLKPDMSTKGTISVNDFAYKPACNV